MTQKMIGAVVCLFLTIAGAPTAWADNDLPETATDQLLAEARAVLDRTAPDKATEKRLEQIVLALSARTATSDARELIETLAQRRPQILVPHEEGGVMIPYVDVGAAARFTIRHWTRTAAYRQTLNATRAGDALLFSNYFASDAPTQAGIIDAILNSEAKDVVLYRDAALNEVAQPDGDRLAAALATTLADETLLQRVIVDGSPAVALDTVTKLPTITDAATALRLMQVALGRSEIASATLFEIGRLSAALPAAEQILWRLLGDPELGGSAAAVLARQADRNTVNQLIDRLQSSENTITQKRIVLALRLSGDAVAMQAARQWIDRAPVQER